jgi:hypothetical protein
LGETLFDASDLAIVAASFVKSPFGGNVDSVFTAATHRLPERDLDDLPRALLAMNLLSMVRYSDADFDLRGCCARNVMGKTSLFS